MADQNITPLSLKNQETRGHLTAAKGLLKLVQFITEKRKAVRFSRGKNGDVIWPRA